MSGLFSDNAETSSPGLVCEAVECVHSFDWWPRGGDQSVLWKCFPQENEFSRLWGELISFSPFHSFILHFGWKYIEIGWVSLSESTLITSDSSPMSEPMGWWRFILQSERQLLSKGDNRQAEDPGWDARYDNRKITIRTMSLSIIGLLSVKESEVLLGQTSVSGSSFRRLSGLQHRGRVSAPPSLPVPSHPYLPPWSWWGPDHLPLRQLHLPDWESPPHHQRLAGQAVSTGVRLILTIRRWCQCWEWVHQGCVWFLSWLGFSWF